MNFAYIMILVLVALIIIFLYFIEPLITKQKIKDNYEYGSARFSTKQEIEKNFKKKKHELIVNLIWISRNYNKKYLMKKMKI